MNSSTPNSTNSCEIIIVNYNAGNWLQRSIDSALKYSDAAITVVDNNSSDQSVEHTQSLVTDARLKWVLNQDNRGFAAANNQALSLLTSDFAVLMNPDCELHEGTLDTLFAAFQQHPEMGLASGRILNEDGSLQATCRRRFPTPWSALVRLLQLHRLFPNSDKFANFDYGQTVDPSAEIEFVEAISGAFMVVRRTALAEVGLLDEAYFMHCEDLDWCKRFALAGWKVGFVPKAAVTHAKGVSSRSRPISVLWTLHRGMNRFFDKFYRADYSLLVRASVKIGIYCSFVVRALKAVVMR